MNRATSPHGGQLSVQELRDRLPLPALMKLLGFGEHIKLSARCPFHDDSHPSFSVHGLSHRPRWRCHAGCGGGDEVDFIAKAECLEKGAAFRRWRQLAENRCSVQMLTRVEEQRPSKACLPQDFRWGSDSEMVTVARLRGVSNRAVFEMRERRVLGVGTVCGQPCWIVTDPSGYCAEARRLDGLMFPGFKGGGPRKAHTLRGSSKTWPVGLGIDAAKDFNKFLILEGSADLVAGYHFAVEGGDWLPIAVLGASVRKLHQEAIHAFRGKHARVVPHVDVAGFDALEFLCTQLERSGCSDIEWVDLRGWKKADGSVVKDLNDCVALCSSDQPRLEGLLK